MNSRTVLRMELRATAILLVTATSLVAMGCGQILGVDQYRVSSESPVPRPACSVAGVPLGSGSCNDVGVPGASCPGGSDYRGGCRKADFAPDPGCAALPGPARWYVDSSVSSPMEDGSAAHPWSELQQAIDGASSGDTIQIGGYGGYAPVVVEGKALKVFVACDSASNAGMAYVGGSLEPTPAVTVRGRDADGTELHGLSLSGVPGVFVDGAANVVLDHLLMLEGDGSGIVLQGADGALVQNASISSTSGSGLAVRDSAGVVVESVAIQGTRALGFHGVGVEVSGITQGAGVTLRKTEITDSAGTGVLSTGATLHLEDVVVRNSGLLSPYASGIRVESGQASLLRTFIEGSSNVGLYVDSSVVDITDSSILDSGRTAPPVSESVAHVMSGNSLRALRASVTIGTSLLDGSRGAGIHAQGSYVALSDSIIRGVKADATGTFGDGIVLYPSGAVPASAVAGFDPGTAVIRRSRIEHSARLGVANFGTQVTMEGAVLECNGMDVAGADFSGALDDSTSVPIAPYGGVGEAWFEPPRGFLFIDEGRNLCGCADSWFLCRRVASSPGASKNPGESLPRL